MFVTPPASVWRVAGLGPTLVPFSAPPWLALSLQVAQECSLAQGGHQRALDSAEEQWIVPSLLLEGNPTKKREWRGVGRERERERTMEASQVHSFPSS